MPRHQVDIERVRALSEAGDSELGLLLAAYEEHVKQNPLLNFQPHPKQIVFLASKEPLKAFLGGNRSGKTTSGIVDDLIQAIDEDVVPEHLLPFKKWTPPFHCRIVAPDFISTMEGVIFNKLREWAPKSQLEGGEWSRAYDKARRLLWFKNGSFFQFLTFEQDVDKHSGAALHRVHFDEEPPEAIRRENLMRLIDYSGDELFTMTPLLGMTWMYDQLYEPWVKGELKHATLVTVDMDDNPYLDAVAKERTLAGMSEEERRARKEGRFVHFGGMVYPEFRRDEHVVPQLDGLPERCLTYVGIDPGIRGLAAAVFVAVDDEGSMIVFDEIGLKGSTAAEMAREIKMTLARWGTEPRAFIIDPAARNLSHQTGRSDQMEYADNGIYAYPGQNDRAVGIGRVKTFLRTHRLMIAANCTGLIDEFNKYRWKSQSRTEDDPKQEPVKTNDHRLDALRYVIMSRPAPAEAMPNIPVMTPLERMLWEDMNGPKAVRKVGVADGGPGRFL